jgi:NAD(P)-dependent dehydrogenase (short-subunit alcohol dehydrogenase family)
MTKTILITGAGSGFGLGTARKLHAQNHRVIGVCQTEEQVSHLTQEGIEAVQVDITNPASVQVLSTYAPDVLVNNAGRGQLGPLATVPIADVRAAFEVNVFGTLQVTQAVLPSMRERGSGRIIIVSSIAGVFSGLLSGPYAMTKHALEAMAKSLRAEEEPYGIEVCKINPGPYATGFNDSMVEGAEARIKDGSPQGLRDAEYAAATRTRMLGNQLDPDEVIDALVQLCSAETVPFETFKPDDILDRYKQAR